MVEGFGAGMEMNFCMFKASKLADRGRHILDQCSQIERPASSGVSQPSIDS